MEKSPKTIAISRWQDMERFGIAVQAVVVPFHQPGREGVFALRRYFLLNTQGQQLLQDYWGLAEVRFKAPTREAMVNGAPAVGGVMMPDSELFPLAEFALFRMEPIGLAFLRNRMMAVFDQELYDQLRTTHTLKFNEARHSLRPSNGSRLAE